MSEGEGPARHLHREFAVGDEIGRGRFGVVRRCYSRATGAAFAVKSTPIALLPDPLDAALAADEPKLHLLAFSACPDRVLPLHDAFRHPDGSDGEEGDAVHLVLPLCPPGADLLSLISARAPLPEPDAAVLLAQLAEALAACHRAGVAHRDVKPDNVLFDAEGNLRLADFGSAGWFGSGGRRKALTGVVGTPYYVAPEVISGGDEEYDEKVDVWSAGVVLYMMLSGTPPFYGETAADVFEAVRRANVRFPRSAFAGVSVAAKDLLRKMLCKDPARRLSADQVLRHPWVVSGGGGISAVPG